MGKKNKKKTIASTRKTKKETVVQAEPENVKKEEKKVFKKLLAKAKDKKNESLKTVSKETVEEKIIQPEPVQPENIVQKIDRRNRSTSNEPQKLKGGILIMIGLFTLLFVGYFVFGKLFRPQPLAEILPAENTLALVEINIDPNSDQTKQFFELLKKYPVYQKENIVQLISTLLPFQYKNDFEPWVARRVGMALMSSKITDQKLSRVYFIESSDQEKTKKFLLNSQNKFSQRTMDTYKGFTLYPYQNKLNPALNGTMIFINKYLIIAENTDVLKEFIDNSEGPKLNEKSDYRGVANNLPQSGLFFAYVQMEKLLATLNNNAAFFAEKGQDIAALKPFLDMFTAEGITITSEKGMLMAQTFTSINKTILQGESYLNFNEKYQGGLLNIANEAPILMMGGHDLVKELSRLQDVFKAGTQTSSMIFDGVMEAQKQIYFGKDLDLKKDIYPLFQGEYLLTVENSFEEPAVTFFLELKDKNKDIPRMERLVEEFVKTNGIFSPRTQNVTLPDGTTGKEIIANPEKIERSDENYNGTPLTTLALGESGWSVYYAFIENKVAFSSNKGVLKKIIDRHDGKVSTNFTDSNNFEENIKPLLQTADQLYTLKIGALSDIFGLNQNKIISPYLLPFSNLTVTKNFFDDGITEMYLIEVI